MTPTLGEVFSHLKSLIDRDTKLGALPWLVQIADDAEDQDAVAKHQSQLEKALENPGVALVAVAADGALVDSSDSRTPILDVENMVMLAIVEKPKKNATGETAFQYVRRALRVLHRGNVVGPRGARADVKLAATAYSLGPMGQGKVIFYVTALVRTSEPLGALTPSA